MNAMVQGPNSLKAKNFSRDAAAGPPSNPYGSKPFLIKVQLPLGAGAPSILIYDQSREIQFPLLPSDCQPEVWSKLESTCRTQGVRGGIKIYVWARRKSDLELSVAIDRLPKQEKIPW